MDFLIRRPDADRVTAVREARDICGLVKNASDISGTVLRTLLEAQSDLLGRTKDKVFLDGRQRSHLADVVAQQLYLLALEAEGVPGKTGEALSKTRLLLEAVQLAREPEPEYHAVDGTMDLYLCKSQVDIAAVVCCATVADAAQTCGMGKSDIVSASGAGSVSTAALQCSSTTSKASSPVWPAANAESKATTQAAQAARMVAAEVTDQQLISFVVDKVAGGAPAFKANKLPQILAALVREECMSAAVIATKKYIPAMMAHCFMFCVACPALIAHFHLCPAYPSLRSASSDKTDRPPPPSH